MSRPQATCALAGSTSFQFCSTFAALHCTRLASRPQPHACGPASAWGPVSLSLLWDKRTAAEIMEHPAHFPAPLPICAPQCPIDQLPVKSEPTLPSERRPSQLAHVGWAEPAVLPVQVTRTVLDI